MTEHVFSLIPFPASTVPKISITGKIAVQKNIVNLHYSMAGKIEDILLPTPSENPGRKHELWKSTCFEIFLALEDRPEYWEFNLSPSGDWNIYRMEEYRRIGFREETSIQGLPFVVNKEVNLFTLAGVVDLNPILSPNPVLKFGITAIIQTPEHHETYWALIHPGMVADFHLRQSFILELAEPVHL